jgi:alpha-D-xyloside xylohydrolase
LAHASNAAVTSFPFVLYNDYYDDKDFITTLINSSFVGIIWTPEIQSSETVEEWLRRFMTDSYPPLTMLNAWQDVTKSWSFPEVGKQVTDVLNRIFIQPLPIMLFKGYLRFVQ